MIAGTIRTVPYGRDQVYINSIPEALLVLGIFTKEIASSRLAGIDFDFISYTFCIGYFVFYMKRILDSPATPWVFFLYIVFSSLFAIFLLNLDYGGFMKQIFSIIVIFSVNFVVIQEGDWKSIFRLYVKLAYYSAIFGIAQFFLSLVGINLLVQVPGRLDSIAYEPSHYAALLMPALIFTFFHLREYKTYFFIMLTALFLTFNLTGYMVFLLVVSFAYINPFYFIVSLPVMYYLIFVVFPNFNENFSNRINDTLQVFQGNTSVLTSSVEANGTTISLYSNLMVAEQNAKDNFLSGAGLGGHEQTYDRYYQGSIFRLNWYYGINAKSGHSLTIRILSEFGVVGLILYIVSLVRRIILFNDGVYRSISLACFSHFLCKTFKLGGIIDYGTPFFFAMLCINFVEYKNRHHSEKAERDEEPALAEN